MHVLVTRPDPAATAARWRAAGATVTEAPVLTIVPRAWSPPGITPDAVVLTSANAVRCAGDAAARYHALPVFAVGDATARAAGGAGWRDVRGGGGTAATTFRAAAAAGFAAVLHLAGANRVAVDPPPGLHITVREVYAADIVDLPRAVLAALAAGAVDVVPLYSPRAATAFGAQVDRAGIDRARIAVAALSPAVAAAAGPGWRAVAVAAAPTGDALFAAARGLCDKAVTTIREG